MWHAHAARALRALPTLALLASLFASALGGSVLPAGAEESVKPVARLQLVVQQVEILDDREGWLSGEGEMNFDVVVRRCKDGVPPPCAEGGQYVGLSSFRTEFAASTGDVVTLDQVLPGEDTGYDDREGVTPKLGIPVLPGEQYVVRLWMWESDGRSSSSEDMGEVVHVLSTGDHGLGIGTHVGRATGADSNHIGDFIVTYEIRRVPLPDLRPVNIKVTDLPGSPNKRVCMAVQNIEGRATGRFEMTLAIDGKVPAGATARADDLAPGTSTELCVETELPASGLHQLTANADLFNTVLEYNETNNIYAQSYTGTGPAGTPKPSGAQPDLTVSTIKVNGRVVGGKDDGKLECKEGKNSVSIVMKNAGSADADDFTVRLAVDTSNDDVEEKSVSGLKAGQEREVSFGDVRLKKGPHTLSATVDGREEIAESNESKNARTVPVGCRDND